MVGGQGMKPKLFQFWNTECAPDEVEVLMQTWARDPAFDYHRFNAETADAFIETNFDGRTLAAYRKCGVPAMQADFFRYCALYVHGGVYVDADTKNSGRLPELLEGRKLGLLMTREARVANDFLYVCDAEAELYRKTIECAILNVNSEISNNVWMVTGPGIMTRFFHDATEKHLLAEYAMEPASIIRNYVLFQHNLVYKKSDDDWRKKIDSIKSSIYLRS
jgi:mannosyltransferase OCH1-like enzyme